MSENSVDTFNYLSDFQGNMFVVMDRLENREDNFNYQALVPPFDGEPGLSACPERAWSLNGDEDEGCPVIIGCGGSPGLDIQAGLKGFISPRYT